MGNWNRRRPPRRKYYQEVPTSTLRPSLTELDPPGVWQNSMASWEKKFCTLVGSIPWQKVMVAKNYMYCHDNVVNWNDSAGEEAFHNAKKRFWAEINGLPCEIPLPEPGMYIDEIDWNPYIDPQLMLDLDQECFNPDAQNDNKVDTTNKNACNSVSAHALGCDNNNPLNCDNPWESSNLQHTGGSRDAVQGWKEGDNSKNLDSVDDPWERGYAQGNGALRDNAWGGCGDSWGRNQGLNTINQLRNSNTNSDNPWEQGNQTVGSMKQKGWVDVRNNSWGNGRVTGLLESRNLNKIDNLWGNNFIRGTGALEDRDQRNFVDNSWDSKHWENRNNEAKYLSSRKSGGDRVTLNGGCRKREGSYQHPWSYKSSRFQDDNYGTGHKWRNRRT